MQQLKIHKLIDTLSPSPLDSISAPVKTTPLVGVIMQNSYAQNQHVARRKTAIISDIHLFGGYSDI